MRWTWVALSSAFTVAAATPISASAGRWGPDHGSDRVAHWVESLHWSDAEVREVSARALGAVGDPGGVGPLLGALDDESGHVREAAAWALGELGAEPAVTPLTTMATHDRYSLARASAVRALGKIGTDDTVAPLRNGLRDRDARVRATAADWLSLVAGRDAYGDLIEMLQDEDWSVRLAAVTGVGRMRVPDAAAPLAIVLGGDDHEYVRAGAAYALALTGGDVAIEALRSAAVSDPSARVRLEAIRSLAVLRVPLTENGVLPSMERQDVPRSSKRGPRTIDL